MKRALASAETTSSDLSFATPSSICSPVPGLGDQYWLTNFGTIKRPPDSSYSIWNAPLSYEILLPGSSRTFPTNISELERNWWIRVPSTELMVSISTLWNTLD